MLDIREQKPQQGCRLGLTVCDRHPLALFASSVAIDERIAKFHDIGAEGGTILDDAAEDRHRFTHSDLPPTAVVGFLHYRIIEVVKVEFSLECEFVIRVEKVESERSFGSVEGGGVPSHS